MNSEHTRRGGFTLVEIVVAIAVLSVGILALAGGAATAVRSMADAGRIASAARMAEAARERAYASPCTAAAGVDSLNGVRLVWSALPAGSALVLRQTITLPSGTSPHAVFITAAGACR